MADFPLVFHDMIKSWPAMKWTPAHLKDIFQGLRLKFRMGRKDHKGVQVETECFYADATMADFNAWIENRVERSNPLRPYPQENWWCYADYKHMRQIFPGDSKVLQDIDWSCFGFPEKNGKDSTFWLGSKGAYTVCHYDTYGCNLVAQLHGRKQWILFPPSDSSFIYPTRIPYEESSVFSKVNILEPDLQKHSKFQKVHPYVLTLNPGDVLYVPRHWWHFVHNLDTSVSVNMWMDMPKDDDAERIKEALAKTLVFAVMAEEDDLQSWLNPTEIDGLSQDIWTENMQTLNYAVQLHDKQRARPSNAKQIQQIAGDAHQPLKRKLSESDDSSSEQCTNKKLKLECQSGPKNDEPTSRIQEIIAKIPNAVQVEELTFSQFLKNVCNLKTLQSSRGNNANFASTSNTCAKLLPIDGMPDIDTVTSVSGLCSMTEDLNVNRENVNLNLKPADLVDCLLDQEVLSLIQSKLLEKYRTMIEKR